MEKARQHTALRRATAILALTASLASATHGTGLATENTRKMIDLPSGAQVYLQEILVDNPGGMGLTYRYRYVLPDLALRVPATTGPAGEFAGDVDHANPQDIDTQALEGEDAEGDYIDDGMIDPEAFDFAPVITVPGAEQAADDVIDRTLSDDYQDALPPAPVATFKDPIHDDVIWLCQNVALPEILKSDKRPAQIVISLSDRESPFGTYDPEVLQLFEAFSLPKDRDTCEWRPW